MINKCPNCGYYNMQSALVCLKCKSKLIPASHNIPKEEQIVCPNCGEQVSRYTSICPKCRSFIRRTSVSQKITSSQETHSPLQGSICRECGEKNEPNANFCRVCGSSLKNVKDVICKNCNKEISHDSVFCEFCGQRVFPETQEILDKKLLLPKKSFLKSYNIDHLSKLIGPPREPSPENGSRISANSGYTGNWAVSIKVGFDNIDLTLNFKNSGKIIDQLTGQAAGQWIETEDKILVAAIVLQGFMVYLIGRLNAELDDITGNVFGENKELIGSWNAYKSADINNFLSSDIHAKKRLTGGLLNQIRMFSGFSAYDIEKLQHFFFTDENDIIRWFEFIRRSRLICSNSRYQSLAESTNIYFIEDNSEVNAYATEYKDPMDNLEPPYIAIFKGLCLAFKTATFITGVGETKTRQEFFELFKLGMRNIGKEIINSGGEFTFESLNAVLNSLTLSVESTDDIISKSSTYFAGCIINVIAHELGHICLSHTVPGSISSDEISREREMQADSFAAEIIKAIEYKEYNSYGGLISRIIFTWAFENVSVTTHPNPRDRVYAFVLDNKALLESGINRDNIDDFLP